MRQITLFIILLALLTVACQTANTVPTAAAVVKAVPPVVPTAEIRQICLTAETVRLRSGAGTGFEELAILKAGDKITLDGTLVIAPDMGVWQPVRFGDVRGFVNSRYVCG